jgi:hypothetical protein
MAYQIRFVAGEHHPKRAVCFLVSDDKKANANSVFDRLSENEKHIERLLRTRFDAWIDNQPNKSARYHGWDRSEFGGRYTNCFVFKAKGHRFYGFLCNPKESYRRYQVCILVRQAKKREHESDETDLKKVEELRMTLAIKKAIKDFFGG